MTSDLSLHLDSKSESPEDARHREAKQAEGDAIQVSNRLIRRQIYRLLPGLHTPEASGCRTLVLRALHNLLRSCG